jgi:hypothetical protein
MLNGKVAGIFKTGMRLNDEAPMAMSDVLRTLGRLFKFFSVLQPWRTN